MAATVARSSTSITYHALCGVWRWSYLGVVQHELWCAACARKEETVTDTSALVYSTGAGVERPVVYVATGTDFEDTTWVIGVGASAEAAQELVAESAVLEADGPSLSWSRRAGERAAWVADAQPGDVQARFYSVVAHPLVDRVFRGAER